MSAPTRSRRSAPPTPGRFARSGGTARRTTPSRRPATAQRRGVAGGWLQRRPPKQSGLKRALGGVSGALPALAKKQRSNSSSKIGKGGKAGGLALLAGAAGLVFKNRDKVASLARRDEASQPAPTPVTPNAAGPVNPVTPPAGDTPGDVPRP